MKDKNGREELTFIGIDDKNRALFMQAPVGYPISSSGIIKPTYYVTTFKTFPQQTEAYEVIRSIDIDELYQLISGIDSEVTGFNADESTHYMRLDIHYTNVKVIDCKGTDIHCTLQLGIGKYLIETTVSLDNAVFGSRRPNNDSKDVVAFLNSDHNKKDIK